MAPSSAGPPSHVVVVGAGVIGVCIAWSVARRGARVTLVDAGEVGGACSFGNAGLISLGHMPIQRPGVVRQAVRWMFDGESPLYIQPRLDLDLFRWLWRFRGACTTARLEENMKSLAALSVGVKEMVDEVSAEAERGGAPAFFYDRRGYMEAYLTDEAWARARGWGDLAARHGYPYEAVPGDELRRREPAFVPEVRGAVWHHHSAFCDPHRFVLATAALARRAGADIRERISVERVETKGGSAIGVRLKDGCVIKADAVVLSAGVWTPALARPLGVRVPLQPAKGYHRDVQPTEPALTTATILGEANMVVTPMGGFQRLAGTLEFSGINLEMRSNRLEKLSAGASRYLRGMNDLQPARERWEWVGMRPCSPDGVPIIGWAPRVRGLFIATGHAMLGLSQGPSTGKVVAEAILDGKASIDLRPMRVERF